MIDFLGHLCATCRGKFLVVWDGLPQHRARLVTEFIRAQRGRLAIERLPAYAPELNPVEYIWGYWKNHALPNFSRAISLSSAIRRAAVNRSTVSRARKASALVAPGSARN